MKKPFGRCTMNIAPNMTSAMPKAINRPKNPNNNASAPSDSAMITRKANIQGIPEEVNNLIVAVNPWPPNRPKSFCEP
jgi:hypothetical protein